MEEQKPFSQITAIVVDDDHDLTATFAEYLELVDVKVLGKAHDGKEAVSLYKQARPDFVFTDLMMPEYDGYYVLRQIKHSSPETKIIVITSDKSHYTLEKLGRERADRILYKPFDIKRLTLVVDDLRKEIQVKIEE